MKEYKIKDLMVPLSEYATVQQNATLFEAINALENAQEEFDQKKYRHRAILVLDKNGDVVGKLTQLAALRALEPKYDEMLAGHGLSQFGFSKTFMKAILDKHRLFEKPLEHICQKAADRRVTKFMSTLSEGEYIDENASVDEAIHLLVMGHHQSLMVTRNEKVVAILRLTDVFAAIFHTIKKCRL